MLNEHFYHASIRRMIAAFGSIFNDIKVVRKDADGEIRQITRVPLAYGPKQKFLARLDAQADLTNTQVAIKLPRLSFEITSLTYDSSIKLNRMNRVVKDDGVENSRSYVYTYAPYRIGIQLNVMAKNQDDALQIIEQIMPYFQPEYTITINEVPEMGIKGDVPIVLTSVNMAEDYEGDFLTRRAIIYSLDFESRIRFYGPVSSQGIINTASVDINNSDTFGFIEEVVETASASGIDNIDDNEITP